MRLILQRILAGAIVAGGLAGWLPGWAQAPSPEPPGAAGPPAATSTTPPPTTPAAGAETGRLRAVLGRIRGAVFGPAKKPLAGLLVKLTARGESGLLRITSTNERGEYVFSDLPAGDYDVEVDSGGFARQVKRNIAVRPPFRNIVDFDLVASLTADVSPAPGGPAPKAAAAADTAPAVVVRGNLVDQEKRPVPEVSVTFAALDGRGIHQTFSGTDGSFNLPTVPPGRYRVIVSSPGYVGLDLKDIEVPAGTGLNLRLSLVDYPLNFKGQGDEELPREEPRPAPTAAPSVTPAPSDTPAPSETPAASPTPSG